jgi:hypothetical protein
LELQLEVFKRRPELGLVGALPMVPPYPPYA